MLSYNLPNKENYKIKYKCIYCNCIFISNSKELKVERFKSIGSITILPCPFCLTNNRIILKIYKNGKYYIKHLEP